MLHEGQEKGVQATTGIEAQDSFEDSIKACSKEKSFSLEKKKLILLSLLFFATESEYPPKVVEELLKLLLIKNKLLDLDNDELELCLKALLY